MFLKKAASFGVSFIFTIMFFTLYKLLTHAKRDIYKGILLMMPYIIVFMLVGTIFTVIIDLINFKSKPMKFIGYLLVGVTISAIVISGIYQYRIVSLLVFLNCSICFTLCYFVNLIKNKIWLYLLFLLPLLFILNVYIFV